ncbi:MAG TPA: ABC transporter ATP-binding protein [Verrucomicrobiae bacterium]
MNPTAPALELQGLSKRFGRFQAVDQLSLAVPAGVMAGFLGPNGAGKSTTLYMISRLVRPSAGSIQAFGVDLLRDHKAAAGTVGITVETPAFYDYLTARQNLELAARLIGRVPPGQIDEILERVGLAERQHSPVRVFSTGMRQRLGIGRTLLGRPRLLILDEPTNGMDPEGMQEVLSFLRQKVREEGLTIFISSHLMSDIEEYCDQVFVLNRGQLVASGAVKELLRPHQRQVRVQFQGTPPEPAVVRAWPQVQGLTVLAPDVWEVSLATEDAAWLNHALHQTGSRIAALNPKQKSLKEFFLAITGDQAHA